MSVHQFLHDCAAAQSILDASPRVYCIVANSIWSKYEHLAVVAVFDTDEMARAYMDACRLPTPVRTAGRDISSRGMVRCHRPDSLLWDFNDPEEYSSMGHGVREANDLLVEWETITANPTPPSGELSDEDFPDLIPTADRGAGMTLSPHLP